MDLPAIAHALGGSLEHARVLTGGVSARVTQLSLALPDGARRTVVVRQPFEPQDLAREHALLAALAPLGIPVARPLSHGPGWIATALVEGDTITAPADLAALAHQLARIHRVPLAALPALPERRLELEPSTVDAQRTIAAALSADTPSAERALLHGDYWPGNLLWQADRIAAVLDWEMAALGDPRSDVATARLEILWACGHAAMEDFTRAYGPVDRRALARWELWTAHRKLRRLPHWGLTDPELARMAALLDTFWREALERL